MSARHALFAAGLLLFASTAPVPTLAQADEAQRHVPLDGQSNFRNLGGYQAADGREVKWGEVFRSGELPRLSDADVDRLDALGVRTVVNFLTPAEIEQRGEDRLPEGVREIEAPIAGADGRAMARAIVIASAAAVASSSRDAIRSAAPSGSDGGWWL